MPNWSTGDANHAADVTLTRVDHGTTPDQSIDPKLYVIKLPTNDGNAIIKSITLPNLGTTFIDTCGVALHILSITTS